MLVFFIVCFK